jgi:hypothetical protein
VPACNGRSAARERAATSAGVARPRAHRQGIGEQAAATAERCETTLVLSRRSRPTTDPARDRPVMGMGGSACRETSRVAHLAILGRGRRREECVCELEESGAGSGWTQWEHVFVKVPAPADGAATSRCALRAGGAIARHGGFLAPGICKGSCKG